MYPRPEDSWKGEMVDTPSPPREYILNRANKAVPKREYFLNRANKLGLR
jgi:hypothetical protein